MSELETAIVKPEPKNEALQTMPKSSPMALMPQTFDQMLTVAKMFAESSIVPKSYRGKPADCFVAMQYGAELGMMPMASVRNIDVIEGSPSLRARAAMGVCIAEHDCDSFVEATTPDEIGKRAVWICTRRGQSYRGEFTIEQAKNAGLLGKTNWKNYPAQMLENRAIAYAARKAYPDKLSGIYTPEEVREVIDLEEKTPGNFSAPATPVAPPAPAPTVEAEVVAEEPPKPDDDLVAIVEKSDALHSEIEAATSHEQLEKLIEGCRAVKDKSRDLGASLMKSYQEQRRQISEAIAAEQGA